uniref:Uncharacterized protein n=1 Tax=Pithovirus LCPAC304 TaxID=2506594 RepID=A0A481ZAX2_9VIRU|nr:MAG: hypothetical protein LCPAC304_06670 [Pithovirus LCPAC304]
MKKMGKRRKCGKCHKPKTTFDIKVKCRPAHEECEANAGTWNLAIFPDPETSTFRPTPNADTEGIFASVTNIVDNHADFTAVGLGNASVGDLFNTIYTLEEPAVVESVVGFTIYWAEVASTKGNWIKFIQTDVCFDDTLTAKVGNVNIVEAGSTAALASAEYEGWAFITQEAL